MTSVQTPCQETSVLRCLKILVREYLSSIYPDHDAVALTDEIVALLDFDDSLEGAQSHINLWNEKDIVTITYGDSIKDDDEQPLQTLHKFLTAYLQDVVNTVHILPFYPFSSDDGFAVINYVEVNQSLGSWQHINRIATEFKLMADLVINHCSSRSLWFDNFKQRKQPGMDYFIECDPQVDLSEVVRPRTSPLLRKTETLEGERYVWCTFSHDQIDLDFHNPAVLLEFIKIIKYYLDNGISCFRLDAVAFLWKEIGTSCINLQQTHEVIRLLRLLIEHVNKDAVVITETNIPNRENLSYFGNANEAHMIYNFALPPLLLYTMLTGKSNHLKQWMMSMPPAQNGTTYFNFIASHDGIGLRPVEGILSDEEVAELAGLMQQFGGDVSWRAQGDGTHKPYELNISLIDAMKGTFAGEDEYQLKRFICAHAIMLALEGVPAFYIHSLLATPNDQTKFEMTSNKRSINRHNWDHDELIELLEDESSMHHQAFSRLVDIITIRKRQRAFHPNATQFTMHFDESLFAFWRQSQDRRQSIFCIYNVTGEVNRVALKDVNLIELDEWSDLISGYKYLDPREEIVLQPYDFVWISNM
jgi:sucrose phosphorylase